ncbi:MAG: ABC transporter permease subunit, partial [Candidatus Borkfalkiaceae bacterium]|nr:ABC transporter permease subunit [Christensenellaceae bacterium]
EAADALGMTSSRKIYRHLVINIMPQLNESMTHTLGSMIQYEATLGYLDLGVPIPGASWGNMINAAKDTDILQYHANVWMPSGICIIASVLAFNFIGDGLRDALDPKMKR